MEVMRWSDSGWHEEITRRKCALLQQNGTICIHDGGVAAVCASVWWRRWWWRLGSTLSDILSLWDPFLLSSVKLHGTRGTRTYKIQQIACSTSFFCLIFCQKLPFAPTKSVSRPRLHGYLNVTTSRILSTTIPEQQLEPEHLQWKLFPLFCIWLLLLLLVKFRSGQNITKVAGWQGQYISPYPLILPRILVLSGDKTLCKIANTKPIMLSLNNNNRTEPFSLTYSCAILCLTDRKSQN